MERVVIQISFARVDRLSSPFPSRTHTLSELLHPSLILLYHTVVVYLEPLLLSPVH